MDLHKPKPWHSVREFLKEYVIIVVGVLTALGAEQVAEVLHHRHEAAETRQALRAEIADSLERAVLDIEEERCYLRVLDLYDVWAKGGARPEVPNLYLAAPLDTVWQEVKSAGVLQMPLAERLDLASLYGRVANLTQIDSQQRVEGKIVRGYLGLETLTPGEARDLRRADAGYRVLITSRLVNEQGFVQLGRKMGLPPPTLPQLEAKYPGMMAHLNQLCGLVGMKPGDAP